MIELNHVSFSYGDDEVLKDISLSFKEGEFCALLGSNGSGKSTLAKLLNGLLVPSTGDVTVCGMNTRDEKRLFDIRKNVGMVFQNPDNQLVTAIVEDEAAFGAENLGIEPEEIRLRVDEALAAVGMEKHRKRQVCELSGGEKQRTAIASVLAMRPKTIVFDEATAMLDPRGRADFMETVQRLRKTEGISVILITHYMDEAAEADRVLVLEKGKILMDGSPNTVFSRAKQLSGIGLDVPQMMRLSLELKKLGLDMPQDVLTVEETADIILKMRGEVNA
ncbi:MAG: energy-coupling factor transporter ATPase [Clostridiales bacterium]|nr:energy-coupling factor transporter ATPase [Clostridiales bacterium]